jgi:prophage regulatory protein
MAFQPENSMMTHKILRLAQVVALTGLSRSSIYRLIQSGQFPTQIKLAERASGWHESDVCGWIGERPKANKAEEVGK